MSAQNGVDRVEAGLAEARRDEVNRRNTVAAAVEDFVMGRNEFPDAILDAGWQSDESRPPSRCSDERAAMMGICSVPCTGRLLFASRSDPEGGTAFSGWNRAKCGLDLASGGHELRLHDLRRSAATGVAASEFAAGHRANLNHATSSAGPLAAVYQRHDYAKEKREALDGWSNEVLKIVRR